MEDITLVAVAKVAVLIGNRKLTFLRADLPKMEYLTMTIKESLRYHSPVPCVPRTLDQPTTIKSEHLPNKKTLTLPKNIEMVLNIRVQHWNGLLFDQPHVSI